MLVAAGGVVQKTDRSQHTKGNAFGEAVSAVTRVPPRGHVRLPKLAAVLHALADVCGIVTLKM